MSATARERETTGVESMGETIAFEHDPESGRARPKGPPEMPTEGHGQCHRLVHVKSAGIHWLSFVD